MVYPKKCYRKKRNKFKGNFCSDKNQADKAQECYAEINNGSYHGGISQSKDNKGNDGGHEDRVHGHIFYLVFYARKFKIPLAEEDGTQ